MKSTAFLILLLLLVVTTQLLMPAVAMAEGYQQPVPSDESIGNDYHKPTPEVPEPRGQLVRVLDIVLFVAAMALATWLILYKRSRRWLVVLLVGVLLYFGFYRGGCVCPIGATQNVALSLVDRTYTVSIVITLLFLLPILAALFFGRVFCGGVCWLGATQDLMLRKPIRVPLLLDKILRWFRWVYLGLVLFWVVGGVAITIFGHSLTVKQRFLICEYDPFVNLFRSVNVREALAGRWGNVFTFAGPWWMWTITGIVVGSAVFIGRPYCRWICPYGAILGVCSRPARKPVTVMPEDCCDCGLCDDACPLGAIENHAAVNATCLACARCYMACPLERERLGMPVPEYEPGAALVPLEASAKKEAPELDRPAGTRRKLSPSADEVDISYVDELVRRHGRGRDAALPILQEIQSRHHYLPTAALNRVVTLTDLSMSQLVGLATFYNQFRLAPIGRHLIRVCHGTACHVAGARRINDAVRLHLHISHGEDTDADRRFTIQEVACLGCCSLAPVLQIDDVTYGHLTTETAVKALQNFEQRADGEGES